MSEANAYVPAANAAAPHDNPSAASTDNTTTLQSNPTASRHDSAAPSVVASDGVVAVTTPIKALNATTAPQVAVTSEGGTVTDPIQEKWRVGLCDVDDLGTCVC